MATGKKAIEEGKAVLGIELGSTRIKAVLIGPDYEVLASGGYDWENRYENGIWADAGDRTAEGGFDWDLRHDARLSRL